MLVSAIGAVLVAGIVLAIVRPGDLGDHETATARTPTTAASSSAPSSSTVPQLTTAAPTTAAPTAVAGGGLEQSGAAGAEPGRLTTTGGTSMLAPVLALVSFAFGLRRLAARRLVNAAGVARA